MIRDYMMLILSLTFFIILSLVISFVYHVVIHKMTASFEATDMLSPAELAEAQSHYGLIYGISTTIQILGEVSVICIIVTSALIVARMRYSPFGIPLAIIFYFIGIFLAMVYSNAYVYMRDTLMAFDATFQVNTYLNWFATYLPYTTGVIGAVLFVFAYVKAPVPKNAGGGLSVG